METVSSSSTTTSTSPSISMNEFALRHTQASAYSFYNGSNDALINLVLTNWSSRRVGDSEGTFIVPVPAEGFFTGIVSITENTDLTAIWGKRTGAIDDEHYYIQNYASGVKAMAKTVEIVVYNHDILASDNQNTSDSDYEIVSINAYTSDEAEPMSPITMARNYLGMVGGTKTNYTADQFAKAIWFWATHANAKPESMS